MSECIRVQHIHKTFGVRKVVDDVSFSVNAGEVFGFVGPNGAGKTTVIKMMTGLLKIDSGAIEINGYDVKHDFEKALAGVGAIIENPEMYKHLTARENLMQYARMHGNISPERIGEVIRQVGLQDRINDKVKRYSLGMRQRLGLAQAILHKPNVLILDEPTNGLDPEGIRELRDTLCYLAHEAGAAVLVSSHILSEMELLCDRVGFISKGRMLDFKTIDEIKDTGLTEQLEYTVEVSDPQVASAFLMDTFACVSTVSGNRLNLHANKEQMSNITAALLGAGIKVYSSTAAERSLEDAFLEIVKNQAAPTAEDTPPTEPVNPYTAQPPKAAVPTEAEKEADAE